MATPTSRIAPIALAVGLAACQSTGGPPGNFGGPATPPPGTGYGIEDPNAGLAPGGAGAVLGGISSSEVGRTLAEGDLQRAAQAEFYALEAAQAGAEYAWSSPETGTRGTIVAGEPYQINRSECRDYTHNVFVSGSERTLRGTACRQPNGTWRSVSS